MAYASMFSDNFFLVVVSLFFWFLFRLLSKRIVLTLTFDDMFVSCGSLANFPSLFSSYLLSVVISFQTIYMNSTLIILVGDMTSVTSTTEYTICGRFNSTSSYTVVGNLRVGTFSLCSLSLVLSPSLT